jgi:Nucleotidyl transferase of unknown function (DUF2204)
MQSTFVAVVSLFATTINSDQAIQCVVPEETAKPVPSTSSVPDPLPEEQQRLFRELLELCKVEKIPYAVSGAFALQQHTGIWRYTKDLDLFLTLANLPLALSALEREGYICEVCDPVWLAKAHRDEFFVDLITGMSNGVIVVDDCWIERAKFAEVLGVRTRVLAPEELIASKLFVTRRERFDGADIAHVVFALRGQLDWQRVLEIAGEHWEMLFWALVLFHYVYPAHPNYVPATLWNDLLERFRNAITHPDPMAPFRGSLVDEKMFAIDMNEWGLEDILQRHREARLEANAESVKAFKRIA